MAITLRPEHEQRIANAIETGPYQNASEVSERALNLLQSEEEWWQDHNAGIHDKIERAFSPFDRGESFSAEESRTGLQERKARWLSDHQS